MAFTAMKLPLFDDYWIDFRKGTTRRWFPPEPFSMAPMGYYASLFFDDIRCCYRIYYENLIDKSHRVLRLAESNDLQHFEPVYLNGSDIIWDGGTGIHGCTVMLDLHETDSTKRYKLCGMLDTDRFLEKSEKDAWLGVEIAFSSDGIHWDRHPELRASPQTSDSLNKLMLDPVHEEYVLFHRSAFADRRISVRRSKDLKSWSDPYIILQPGPNYNDEHTGIQHYSMTADYYDGVFYGLLWRYNTGLGNMDFSRMFGYMEPELVYSYDGREYLYTSGKPLIERPYPPAPGCAGLSPQDMCESHDHQYYYILCSGSLFEHGIWNSADCIREMEKRGPVMQGNPIYRIRKDGFCGIESIGQGGLVITKGLCLQRNDLRFNLRANCGSARFGLMDIEGQYFDGFSPDDCIPFCYEDSVSYSPVWKNHTIDELIGRQLRIVIELNNAILHCISASAQPYIRQKQKSFGSPEGIINEDPRDREYHFPGQFNR